MSLRIVKASEPMHVSNIVLTAYAAPSMGKSTLAFTADKPLLLDFDKGAYRACNRGDAVQANLWSDVEKMDAADLEPYHTIVVDTVGRALDALAQDIISGNPKAGRADGSLSLQGFGTLKSRFAGWQSFLRSQGKDLVLLAHMDEQRSGDDVMERIDAQGSSKNEIYKSSDAMCRIRLDNKDARYLDFDPRQGGFGKNPAQLPRMPFPHPDKNPHFLADVIAQIKASINKLTTEQADVVKELEKWAEEMLLCPDVASFNATILPQMKENKEFKAYAAKVAKDRGYRADKATGLYLAPLPVEPKPVSNPDAEEVTA